MNKLYIMFSFIFAMIISQEFNPGPYGIEYFDIAGPFNVSDLNGKLMGDINQDDVININDVVIMVGVILETIDLAENEYIADLNYDEVIDILNKFYKEYGLSPNF